MVNTKTIRLLNAHWNFLPLIFNGKGFFFVYESCSSGTYRPYRVHIKSFIGNDSYVRGSVNEILLWNAANYHRVCQLFVIRSANVRNKIKEKLLSHTICKCWAARTKVTWSRIYTINDTVCNTHKHLLNCVLKSFCTLYQTNTATVYVWVLLTIIIADDAAAPASGRAPSVRHARVILCLSRHNHTVTWIPTRSFFLQIRVYNMCKRLNVIN